MRTETADRVRRLAVLAQLVTVRQVIEAGNEAIDAAGLNPWCINEGLADGSERLHLWWVDDLVAEVEALASAHPEAPTLERAATGAAAREEE